MSSTDATIGDTRKAREAGTTRWRDPWHRGRGPGRFAPPGAPQGQRRRRKEGTAGGCALSVPSFGPWSLADLVGGPARSGHAARGGKRVSSTGVVYRPDPCLSNT